MPAPLVMTVLGPTAVETLGITDAPTHAWIAAPPGTAPDVPRLTDRAEIAAELADYQAAGGGAVVDCQPGGCGRDGRVLADLARGTGVHVVACTGYHRRRYHPVDAPIWRMSEDDARALFVDELTDGLHETAAAPVAAGFLQAACEATVEYFARRGVPPARLVLFHMDKRPDFGLHRALAAAGILLEYDTFYRPQHYPETAAWPLLERMVDHGLEHAVALGTDMADAAMWARLGRSPGLPGFAGGIRARLAARVPASAVRPLMGGNIARRLARGA